MSESFGTRQEAAEHIRRADVKWTEAVRTFHSYPAAAATARRGRRDPAQGVHVRRAVRRQVEATREHRATATWPRGSSPAIGSGRPELWATFDQALEHFGAALAGDSLMEIAQAFGEIAKAANAIAEAIEADAPTAATG